MPSRLFQPFSQADNTTTRDRRHQLGLVICRQLAERMGGLSVDTGRRLTFGSTCRWHRRAAKPRAWAQGGWRVDCRRAFAW
jgi:hypothetical protein